MPQVMTDAKATRRRKEIIEAASVVFAEKGYRETGIADIAGRLGMGHGTFYRYFKNKRDIFLNVVLHMGLRMTRAIQIEPPGASNSAQDYREQVRRLSHHLINLIREDSRIVRILMLEALTVDEELTQAVIRGWDHVARVTESYLVNGKKKGFLRADLDTQVTSMAINAIMFDAMRRGVAQDENKEMAERWINAVVALMFDGMTAR